LVESSTSTSNSSKISPQRHLLFPSSPYLASPQFRSSPFSMLSSLGLRWPTLNLSSCHNSQLALHSYFRVAEEEKRLNKNGQDSNNTLIENGKFSTEFKVNSIKKIDKIANKNNLNKEDSLNKFLSVNEVVDSGGEAAVE
jgi:hypothetical protein